MLDKIKTRIIHFCKRPDMLPHTQDAVEGDWVVAEGRFKYRGLVRCDSISGQILKEGEPPKCGKVFFGYEYYN